MKRTDLSIIKERAIRLVRMLPYGSNIIIYNVARIVAPLQVLEDEELDNLFDAVWALDKTNEMVFDYFKHYGLEEGMPYNMDFIKLKNKGIPDNGCSRVEFGYNEGNYRKIVLGEIDLRTGRYVIDDFPQHISKISERNRKKLSKLFIEDDFIDEERELIADKDTDILDGIYWYVSIRDDNCLAHKIYGRVADLNEIPMKGAKELFKVVQSHI